MKKRFNASLNDMKKLWTDDPKALSAIDYLLEKVEQQEWKIESRNSSDGSFELPREFDGEFAIFSDGACRGNPGPGAWGTMIQDKEGNVIHESSGVDLLTTNNKMELEGALNGLEWLASYMNDQGIDQSVKVFLYSDSRYLVDGALKWIAGWKARGWKKADKKVPENLELWKRVDHYQSQFDSLSFHWVKGHAGHPQNEHCDSLANKALDDNNF